MDAGASIAGWYGKLPCLGDFASRRLPAEFIAKWDGWLQRSIAESRNELREGWLDAFLTSPIWRFALGCGICGESAWWGIVMPSVDKIGRYFPLTFALPVQAFGFDPVYLFGDNAWYEDLERIALSALDLNCSVDALESALEKNPLRARSTLHKPTSNLAEWMRTGAASPLDCHFGDRDSFLSMVHASTATLWSQHLEGRSLWWSSEQSSGSTELRCVTGLPNGECYARMLRRSHRFTVQ